MRLPAAIVSELRTAGYALLEPEAAAGALDVELDALAATATSWQALPRDSYLRDGGHYRARRHSCFVYAPGSGLLQPVPQRPHWQPTTYNALHGGMLRWFEPIEPAVAANAAFRQLLASLGTLFAQLRPVERWYIEAHQFRIDTAGGIGRPTPEGAHRDGVDFVAVVLVRRSGVRGGETRVFEAQGSRGVRFTMVQPWSMLLLDDAQVIHETTPIQAEIADGAPGAARAVRDTLVLTYRAGGFQEPAAGG
ncbi:MAG: 2OG-Fe dioxygenase family protein [Gammaproteobacteria bacterium]|nr:2OG-Fe dioxygenase family protein [Gammaproteobacteria bacterium]